MAGVETSRSAGFLKILFLLHLILSSWGMQSVYTDHPDSYLYYNIIFMASLLWAIVQKTGLESTSLAILITIACTVLDCLTLSLYWRGGPRSRVYFGFAIANAVLRPITCILLYQLFKDRDTEGVGIAGAFADIVGPLGVVQNGGAQGYSDMNETTPANPQGQAQTHSSNSPSGYQAV